LGVENVDEFLHDLTVGFTYLSRIRGKKQDSNNLMKEIIARFDRFLAETESEGVATQKKRGREIDPVSPDKKISKINHFGTKEKVFEICF
jgi:hypothetical protein